MSDIIYGIYIPSILEKRVYLSINDVGSNIKEILERHLHDMTYNKCIAEGFIKPNTIDIRSYSCGIVQNDKIEFVVLFECMVANPVEGQLIECKSKTITKAGIHGHVIDNDIVPIHVFLAKDHHNMNKYFNSIKEDMDILINVIGVRFELNDQFISIIGKLVDKEAMKKKQARAVKATE
jgi:DNA-directed RNA polymerase subunit E'/Rpb7